MGEEVKRKRKEPVIIGAMTRIWSKEDFWNYSREDLQHEKGKFLSFLFSLERIEEILKLLREIFELDLLDNLNLYRLEIYAGILQQVVRELITYVTKTSKKSYYEQTTSLDLDFEYEPFYDSDEDSIPELV